MQEGGLSLGWLTEGHTQVAIGLLRDLTPAACWAMILSCESIYLSIKARMPTEMSLVGQKFILFKQYRIPLKP